MALSWDAPAADSGVTRHEYRFKTTGDYGGWTAIPASARGETNALGYTVARLGYQVDSVDFLFQVRAVSAAGAGAAAESDPVTPLPPPVVPTSCTLNPGDVWCGTVTVGEMAESNGKTLRYGFHQTWHADGVGGLPDRRIVYGANSYRIDEVTVGVEDGDRPAGFLWFSLNRAFPAAERVRLALYVGSDRFLLSKAHGPHNAPTYHWRGTGLDWSSTYSVTLRLRADLPPAPSAVTATTPPGTGGLLEVGWSALASPLAITGYEVNYWKAADAENGPFRTARTESTVTSMLLFSLAANTEYKLRVRARSAIGTGAWSEVATARTGAKQPGKPILSLAVVDKNGADTAGVATGGRFRYRIKVTNLRNHHYGGNDPTGWGTLGVRGGFEIDYILERGTAGGHLLCDGTRLFLKDWTRTSYTAGYWEFESPLIDVNASLGPLRLRMGFECTGKSLGGLLELDTDDDDVIDYVEVFGESDGVVTSTSDSYTLGSPAEACLSIENSLGTIVHACPARRGRCAGAEGAVRVAAGAARRREAGPVAGGVQRGNRGEPGEGGRARRAGRGRAG